MPFKADHHVSHVVCDLVAGISVIANGFCQLLCRFFDLQGRISCFVGAGGQVLKHIAQLLCQGGCFLLPLQLPSGVPLTSFMQSSILLQYYSTIVRAKPHDQCNVCSAIAKGIDCVIVMHVAAICPAALLKALQG